MDCLGHPIYCRTCCRSSHALNPFHRVQHWAGEYFEDLQLINTGLIIHFRHGGKPCPSINITSLHIPTSTHEPDTATPFGLPNLVEEMDDPNDDLDLESSKLSQMEAAEAHELLDMNEVVDQELETHVQEEWNPDLQKSGQNVLIIVNVNGVHHLPVQWCSAQAIYLRISKCLIFTFFQHLSNTSRHCSLFMDLMHSQLKIKNASHQHGIITKTFRG